MEFCHRFNRRDGVQLIGGVVIVTVILFGIEITATPYTGGRRLVLLGI